MTDSASLEGHIELVKKARESFRKGKQYLNAKKYKRSLECLLFAFDNGHLVDGWGGVRLSYVPSTIAELGKHYAPAIEALRDRRDAREKLIFRSEDNFDIFHEWNSLNRYLGENEHALAVIDQLEAAGNLRPDLESLVVSDNRDFLLKRREYGRLGKHLNKFVSFLLICIADYQAEKDFPQFAHRTPKSPRAELAWHKRRIRHEGSMCFEIALGCRRRTAASKIMNYLLNACPDSAMYTGLMRIVQRMKQTEMRETLLKRAKNELQPAIFRKLRMMV